MKMAHAKCETLGRGFGLSLRFCKESDMTERLSAS